MRFESDFLPDDIVIQINRNITAIEEWLIASQEAFEKSGKEQRVFADSREERRRRPIKMKPDRFKAKKKKRYVDVNHAYKPNGFIGPVPY